MNSFPLVLVATIILAYVSPSVKSCAQNEDTLTLRVNVEFYEESIKSAYTYSKTIKSSKYFKKALEKMSTSASVSGSYGAFSASASASYSSLSDSVLNEEKYGEEEKEEKTVFKDGFLQITREIKTILYINGRGGSITEKKIVDSVPEADSMSAEGLRQRAVDYMKFKFGEGAVRDSFTEKVCRKKLEKSEILKETEVRAHQVWNDKGTGAWRDFSCWNPVGNDILASFPENGYAGPGKSFVFKGAEGVLDSPRDYRRTWKDSGSGSSRDVSFWEPLCNKGYVALGDLCKIGHGKPSKIAMKCIREDLTKPCGKTQIWTDKGTGAWQDARVFKSYDQLVQGMVTTNRQAYCLK